MDISWGYSPKTEKFIPLGDFPADQYLIIVRQAIENLGWELSHVSESGIIAYTPLSLQSYSEQITVRILNNFVHVKSECLGIQLLFNDYGKNNANLEKLFHEFEYVQFHLQNEWEEQVQAFHNFAATQDDSYFDRAPLAIKNKITNIFNLLLPQKGYTVTPIIVLLNIIGLGTWFLVMAGIAIVVLRHGEISDKTAERLLDFGVLSRKEVLDGEYWRLLTYQFLHSGIRHLFFNMYALVYLGLIVENKLGWKKFLIVYLLSGICGGFASIVFRDSGGTIGSSGAVMGIFGALLAMILHKFFEPKANRALLISTVFVLAIMLVSGLTNERVDNACHFGGIIGGFIITNILIFDRNKQYEFSTPVFRYLTVALFFGTVTFSVFKFTPQYQNEEFLILKNDFNKNSASLNRLFTMKGDATKAEKANFVKRNVLAPAKANLVVVRQMKGLLLNKKYDLDRSLKVKLAEETHATVLFVLEDIESDHVYRQEVAKRLSYLQRMQIKYADSLNQGRRR
jgi:rhomboid protease GluP